MCIHSLAISELEPTLELIKQTTITTIDNKLEPTLESAPAACLDIAFVSKYSANTHNLIERQST